MRKQIATLLLLSIFLMFTGCAEKPSEDLYLNFTPYELPLSELWTLTVNETGVENETASFSDLMIRIGPHGLPEHVLLEFCGVKEDRRNFFHVEVNRQGHVSWYSGENVGGSFRWPHPLELLGEIEKVRFREIDFGKDGLSIEVFDEAGNVSYKSDKVNCDIFGLENGKLIPLESVSFSSEDFRYPVLISKRGYYNVLITENRTTGEDDIVFLLEKEPLCFYAFTERDLSRAEMLVYAENNETV